MPSCQLILFVLILYCNGSFSDLIAKRAYLSSKRDAVGGIRVDDRFYFAGGFEYNDYVATDIVDVYNITSGEWEEPLRLSQPRGFISSAVIGDNVYFIGGITQFSNCSLIYNTTLHNYEQIGCGPAVVNSIQVSTHNSIVTFLGSFSADFFNIASKEWYYIHALTSRMQEISNGITVTHENLIIGIGGVNTTTLERLFDAWIFDIQTSETIVFSNVTTLNELSPVFKFSTGLGKIVFFTSDRYFVHQFGTTQWHERPMANIFLSAALSDVVLLVNSTGVIVYDPSAGDEKWTAETVDNIFPFETQVAFGKRDSILVYETGVWTEISLGGPIILAERWFDKQVFYLEGELLRLSTIHKQNRSQSCPPFQMSSRW
jgi:hypothetical protein